MSPFKSSCSSKVSQRKRNDPFKHFHEKSTHSNTSVKELAKNADSISFCLSKGLSAPVGSLVCGTQKFISTARKIRKSLGGGMRQAGIIAAAGLVSLDSMIDQIKLDHHNAQKLAKGMENFSGIQINIENVHTNIVYFQLESKKGPDFVQRMANKGILFFEVSTGRCRMVTHRGITTDDIVTVLRSIEEEIE